MNNTNYYKSADDKEISLLSFNPKGKVKGALVLVYEIFGCTKHITDVATNLSNEGYKVLIPDLFSRIKKKIVLDYDEKGIKEGKALKVKLGWEYPVMDIVSCASILKLNHDVGVIGFCYGGSLAWRAVQKSYLFNCAVSYYGSQIPDFLDLSVNCPVQLHFGESDASITKKNIDTIDKFSKNLNFEVSSFVYKNADHGFNCDHRSSYNEEASKDANSKTLNFFDRYLNG